jgi:hypothetical protein
VLNGYANSSYLWSINPNNWTIRGQGNDSVYINSAAFGTYRLSVIETTEFGFYLSSSEYLTSGNYFYAWAVCFNDGVISGFPRNLEYAVGPSFPNYVRAIRSF